MSTSSPGNDKVLIDVFDYFLPRYNFSERHAITIHGQPSDILDTIADYQVQMPAYTLGYLPTRTSRTIVKAPVSPTTGSG